MAELNERQEQLKRALALLSDMINGSPLAQFDMRVVAYALIMYATNTLRAVMPPDVLAAWLEEVLKDIRESRGEWVETDDGKPS
jgi:hypothetical protein